MHLGRLPWRLQLGRARETARRGANWGLDYAFALRSISTGLIRSQLPRSFLQGSKAPVVLVPGVLEDWTMMRPVATRLSAAGHPVFALPELHRNTVTVPQAAALALECLRQRNLRGVVLVAHSKGGLVGKTMLLNDGEHRIERLVAIAAPFHGSQLAYLLPVPMIFSMRPRDVTIRNLEANSSVNSRIVSIYPVFDPHIPGGSQLEGATNIPVSTMGHFKILADHDLLDAVEKAAQPPE